jgi:hypothetical protein
MAALTGDCDEVAGPEPGEAPDRVARRMPLPRTRPRIRVPRARRVHWKDRDALRDPTDPTHESPT